MTCYTAHGANLNCVVNQPEVSKSQLHVLVHYTPVHMTAKQTLYIEVGV